MFGRQSLKSFKGETYKVSKLYGVCWTVYTAWGGQIIHDGRTTKCYIGMMGNGI